MNSFIKGWKRPKKKTTNVCLFHVENDKKDKLPNQRAGQQTIIKIMKKQKNKKTNPN